MPPTPRSGEQWAERERDRAKIGIRLVICTPVCRAQNTIENSTFSTSTYPTTTAMAEVLPLEIIDKSIGHRIKVLMTNEKEFTGTLVGFDDFVNMVLEDVEETDAEGTKKKMLLNGGHVAMIVPLTQ